MDYNNIHFGIIEIPINHYDKPITATVKLKGMSPSTIYIRRGSMNDEATGIEAINISEWLKFNKKLISDNKHEEKKSLFEKINYSNYTLTPILLETLKYAERYEISDLIFLCKNELSGWELFKNENSKKHTIHRTLTITYLSTFVKKDITIMSNLYKITGNAHEAKTIFGTRVTDLEKWHKNILFSKEPFYTFNIKSVNNIKTVKKCVIAKPYGYLSKKNIETILINIKELLIKELFKS